VCVRVRVYRGCLTEMSSPQAAIIQSITCGEGTAEQQNGCRHGWDGLCRVAVARGKGRVGLIIHGIFHVHMEGEVDRQRG
jgi:hypothetical protein